MYRIFSFIAVLATANIVLAQKLPTVQQISLRAPANIKIDGKATEWGDKFQAYNNATDLFYTLANDDNKLYLTVQATDANIIAKIMQGKITFTINALSKKNDDKSISISYPVINRDDRPGINLKEKPEIRAANTASILKADSFMNISNKRFTEKTKLIKVTGVKDVDSLISVYNTDGIKAVALFNNKMYYTYELSADLKLLGPWAKTGAKLYYNIKLNGLSVDDIPGVTVLRSANGAITGIDVSKTGSSISPRVAMANTDFWGEYTLANR